MVGVDDRVLSVRSGDTNVDGRKSDRAEGRGTGENICRSLGIGIRSRVREVGGGGPADFGASGRVRESGEVGEVVANGIVTNDAFTTGTQESVVGEGIGGARGVALGAGDGAGEIDDWDAETDAESSAVGVWMEDRAIDWVD